MAFEYDPRKSERNLAKHGIDFLQAQSLWDDSNLLEIPAKTEDDPVTLSLDELKRNIGRL